MRKVKKWWRSSVTGRFVSKAFAKLFPRETEEQEKR
jgi:hypothetical protein